MRLAIVLATAFGFVACGGDSTTTTSDMSANGADLAGTTDGGTSHDLAVVATNGAGTVTLSVLGAAQSESASFSASAAVTALKTYCTTSGSCQVCLFPNATAADMAGVTPANPPDTGVITLANGTTTITTLTPSSSTGLYTAPTPQTTNIAAAGNTIHFSSVGNSVPAITDTTVIVPHTVAVTAPASSLTGTAVTKSAGVALTWTGGTTGEKVIATLSAYKLANAVSSDVATITCTFDSGAGTGTVPTSALTDQTNGALTVSSANNTVVHPTGYDVTLATLVAPSPTWAYIINAFN